MNIIAAIINVYIFLIIIYVLLTYFPEARNTKLFELLYKTVEPYLRIFSFARVGGIDFSPLIGIAVLEFMIQLLNSIYI